MKKYKFGDIILLAFPFSGANIAKQRPALVLKDTGDDDIIAARITSQKQETEFDLQIKHWRESGLLLPSIIRIHKIATLNKSLIKKEIGNLSIEDSMAVSAYISKFWKIPD